MLKIIEFFSMGNYGCYVWPAYIFTVIVLVGNFIVAKRQTKK